MIPDSIMLENKKEDIKLDFLTFDFPFAAIEIITPTTIVTCHELATSQEGLNAAAKVSGA